MEETNPPAEPQNRYQVLKLVAYFVVVILVANLLRYVFWMLEGTGSFESFARLHAMILDSLDITRKHDDTIVTIWSLVNTLILVLPLGWVYSITKSREGYDRTLVQTLIVMAMVVCAMMMIIQDQFSRALALVGVVSAVRFRTNVKDPKDAVYLLVAIGVGMGSGLGVYHVVLWMTVIMCVTFLGLSFLRIGEQPAGEAGFIDIDTEEKRKKKKKKDKEKHKEKHKHDGLGGNEPGDSGQVSRYARVADALKDAEHNVKRPNRSLVVLTSDPALAIAGVSRVMESHGLPFHHIGTTEKDGVTTLEYLIRVDGDRDGPFEIKSEIEDDLGNVATSVETAIV